MMESRKPTKPEKAWLDDCVQIPCLACSMFHCVHDSPAEYHHIDGKTKPEAHLKGFSLCAQHHRHKDNCSPPRWVSRHGDGLNAFEKRYMSEPMFLHEMQRRVEKLQQSKV